MQDCGRTIRITELIPFQMLVGTIAFNTLEVIEPANSSALAIWALGYVFQGLGMAITFIVRPVPLCLVAIYS